MTLWAKNKSKGKIVDKTEMASWYFANINVE